MVLQNWWFSHSINHHHFQAHILRMSTLNILVRCNWSSFPDVKNPISPHPWNAKKRNSEKAAALHIKGHCGLNGEVHQQNAWFKALSPHHRWHWYSSHEAPGNYLETLWKHILVILGDDIWCCHIPKCASISCCCFHEPQLVVRFPNRFFLFFTLLS